MTLRTTSPLSMAANASLTPSRVIRRETRPVRSSRPARQSATGGVDDRADPGHHPAPDERGHLERHRRVDGHDGLRGHDGLLGERADAQRGRDGALGRGQRRRPLGPRRPARGAQLGLPAPAEPAAPARRDPHQDHVLARPHGAHPGPDLQHFAGALVAEHGRDDPGQGAVLDGQVGVAHPACSQRDPDLTRPRVAQPQVVADHQGLADPGQRGTTHRHRRLRQRLEQPSRRLF
jgi:hypothetical protein